MDADTLDCLNDLGAAAPSTLSELLEHVLGAPTSHPLVVGSLVLGAERADAASADGFWGAEFRIGFLKVRLRSSPKGRLGLPLSTNEERVILVRTDVAAEDDAPRARVATIRIRHLPPLPEQVKTFVDDSAAPLRVRVSCAPETINVLPVSLFERHNSADWRFDANGHCMIVNVYTDIQLPDNSASIAKVMSSIGEFGVVASLCGVAPVEDDASSARLGGGVILSDATTHSAERARLAAIVSNRVQAERPSVSENGMLAGRAFFEAEQVLMRLSPVGVLDARCSPVARAAAPRALFDPLGLPLLLAAGVAATRTPARYRATSGYPDDVVATTLLNGLLDAAVPQPLEHVGALLERCLARLRKKCPHPHCKQLPEHFTTPYAELMKTLVESANALYRIGVCLAIDTCGVPPNPPPRAECSLDPTTVAAMEGIRASDARLGHVRGTNPPRLDSTRAARQVELLAMLETSERALEHADRPARQEAARLLESALLRGCCVATAFAVDVHAYPLSAGALLACGSCSTRFAAAVDLAFGGVLARCAACGRPRCAECIDSCARGRRLECRACGSAG